VTSVPALQKKPRRAVFLDRDGTINRLVYYPDHGFVDSPFSASQLKLLPGALHALKLLRKKGFMLILVSNQPGVAKGNMTRQAFAEVDRKFDSLLASGGARLDAKYYCQHHPAARLAAFRKKCSCRKPEPGLILRASREYGISLRGSYMAGDGIVDVKAGRAAGCRTVFIGDFKPELWKYFRGGRKPDVVAKSLLEAVRKIR
jgi:D-glycero-D-manno-heptose 1,7-bisphosphate phosphatase